MNKYETMQKFEEEMHDTVIEKLVWVSAAHSKDLYSFLEDMGVRNYASVLPDVNFDMLGKFECKQQLCEKGYHGFIAECHIPVPRDISFNEDGEVTSLSSSHGHCRVFVVYGHTAEELTKNIEKESETVFDEMVQSYKKKYA